MKTEVQFIENSIAEKNKTAHCQNCSHELTGEFCAVCGQKYPQNRLTMKELLHLAYEAFFDFDRGFFFTLKELFLHPQQVIRAYLQGKRIVFTNPVKYLFLWLGLSTFIAFSFLDVDGFTQEMSQEVQWKKVNTESAAKKAKVEKLMKQMNQMQKLVLQNPQFVYAVLIPILSFCTFLFFRGQRLTYAEHLLANTYVMSQTIIVTIPSYVFYYWFPKYLMVVTMASLLLSVLYYALVVRLTFGSSFWHFVKGFFSYLLAYLSLIFAIAILVFVYTVWTIVN